MLFGTDIHMYCTYTGDALSLVLVVVCLSVSALQRSNCCESKHKKKAKPMTPEFALRVCEYVEDVRLRVS